MEKNKYFAEFGKPFDVSDISWKIQRTTKDKSRGLAVPYLDARAISDRLDSVVGQNMWKDEYTKWHPFTKAVRENGVDFEKRFDSQLCTIYIYDDEHQEWIGKTDGAENTDFESIKGGISDAFKRAAVKWNIGRYLYSFDAKWVYLEEQYGRQAIKESEIQRLEGEYSNFIETHFNKQSTDTKGSKNPQSQVKNAPNAENQGKQNPKQTERIFEVKNVRVNRSGENPQSQLIIINDGKTNNAFMQGYDANIKAGTKLRNVKGRTGKNAYGEFVIIDSYEIAA